MQNDIINFLNIEDKDVIVTNIVVKEREKEIYIEKLLKPEYCPLCSSKMYSKGIYKRVINHPILQDGFKLKLIVSQRKWRCTNSQCNLYFNDQFNFISKGKQSSNITPYLILNEMKNINVSTADVAKRFNVSDTAVHYTFLQYLDIKRLPLPEILSIDEVHLDMDYKHKYVLVLMDFKTGDIVDILPNRWEETTSAYFNGIPKEERDKVKYLICDMYNPYINYTKRYFHKSIALIDSFHVVAWMNSKINAYINAVKKKYQERDKKLYEEKIRQQNKTLNEDEMKKQIPVSKEVYLLNNFKWILLQNVDNIEYKYERKYNSKLDMYINTYDYEKLFFELDDNFKTIRILKEKYIEFNNSKEKDHLKLEKQLDELITEYSKCSLYIFRDFSDTLKKHKKEIINSFIYIKDDDNNERRLSNGPIEGYNRIPKDFKRNARGFNNFEYVRSRLIWSNRKNEAILAIPKSKEEVYKYQNKKK